MLSRSPYGIKDMLYAYFVSSQIYEIIYITINEISSFMGIYFICELMLIYMQ